MAGGRPPSFISFTCANCQALYHVVKVEAGPETTEAEVQCPGACVFCAVCWSRRQVCPQILYAAQRSARSNVDRPKPGNVPRRQFRALVPDPCALRPRTRLLALFRPPGRRRRCSAQTVADQDAVGGLGRPRGTAAQGIGCWTGQRSDEVAGMTRGELSDDRATNGCQTT